MYNKLTHIAILSIPVSPVIVFGWHVGAEVYGMTGYSLLAIPAGLLTAIGLELIGILAGHVALQYYRQRQWVLFLLSVAVLLCYVLIGASELDGTIGETVFYITPLVYVLAGLQENLTVVRKKEIALNGTELEKWKIQEQNKQERALARIGAKSMPVASAKSKNANAKVKPHTAKSDTGIYECSYCEFETDNSRSYNAHVRWCKNKPE